MGVMSTPEGTSDGGLGVPVDLRQRLQDTRVATAELMERLLASAQSGDTAFEARPGTEMLLFSTRGVQCVLPLTALREVLPELPSACQAAWSERCATSGSLVRHSELEYNCAGTKGGRQRRRRRTESHLSHVRPAIYAVCSIRAISYNTWHNYSSIASHFRSAPLVLARMKMR